ncbi:hypothetical protein SLS60_005631 [Paraconiothyrium brasiliense]|uniref:Uncharacterized protein n=1 Tax=Paraconiothyrium brasiliense TaxID=300254 RepID=A0ABR3RHY6_9PLEO
MTVPLLQNGLLDLSKTPDHLIPIAQRNAIQSPLLRLPAEIRSKIFQYATGGGHFLIAMPHEGNITDLRRSGVYLPQVSRQIYSETATLIFENNTFALDVDRMLISWVPYRSEQLLPLFINALIPAQRASIRELEFIGLNQLLPLAHRFQDREPPLTAVFPNLGVIWLAEGYEEIFGPLARRFPDMNASDFVNYIVTSGEHKRVDIAWY